MTMTADFLRTVLTRVQAAGFDQAEVIGVSSEATEMQIDAGDVSLMRNTENIELMLRGISKGRYATLGLNQLDDESVAKGITKLREAAESAPFDEARAFAPRFSSSPVSDGPVEPSLDDMYAKISGFVTTIGRHYPELSLEQSALKFERDRQVRVNSQGLETDESEGFYSMNAMFSSKRGEKASSFNFAGAVSQDLSKELINWGAVERVISNSVKEIDHAPFVGKIQAPVILTPEVAFEMIGTWFSHLEDHRLIAGTSQLEGKLGQQVASPLLTVRVEPVGSEFARHEHTTGDGYPSRPSVVVDKGVLKTYLLTDYGSRRTKLPRAENSFVNRVIDAGDSALEDMIAKVPKGLLLARFSGGIPAANGDFSGVAKNSFLIENGRVTTPVSEVMISGNAFDLVNSISAISRERVNDGTTLTPWIKVENLTLAGG